MVTQRMLLLGLCAALMTGAAFAAGDAGQAQCPQSPKGDVPKLTGTTVPQAVVFSPEGKQVLLKKVLAAKPTVLVVYRGNWCLYCEKQLAPLQTIEPQLTKLGSQIVVISPDSPSDLRKPPADTPMNYQIYSDMSQSVANALGVAYYTDSTTAVWLDLWGWSPDAASAQPEWKLPDPSIFIVGTDGRIEFEYVGAKNDEAVKPDVVLASATCLAGKK